MLKDKIRRKKYYAFYLINETAGKVITRPEATSLNLDSKIETTIAE